MGQACFWQDEVLTRTGTDIVQINVGNRCNQSCFHCHVEASDYGDRNMDYQTARNILNTLLKTDVREIEFTGGTPELNPNMEMFIEELAGNNKNMAVRTNLTVLEMPEYSFFIDLYRKHRVKVIASLPSPVEDLTDRQRGPGVFRSSLNVLKRLNALGYGRDELTLHLVHNAGEAFLTSGQGPLEEEYRELITDRHGISFNSIITIINTPVGRFKNYLVNQGRYEDYMKLLINNFNPATLKNLMCRHLISVDYQGYLYDCDFNLALGVRVRGYEQQKFWELDFDTFNPAVSCNEHCYACTAGMGSSCHGALVRNEKTFISFGCGKGKR